MRNNEAIIDSTIRYLLRQVKTYLAGSFATHEQLIFFCCIKMGGMVRNGYFYQ